MNIKEFATQERGALERSAEVRVMGSDELEEKCPEEGGRGQSPVRTQPVHPLV